VTHCRLAYNIFSTLLKEESLPAFFGTARVTSNKYPPASAQARTETRATGWKPGNSRPDLHGICCEVFPAMGGIKKRGV